jgi:hypothetical protein
MERRNMAVTGAAFAGHLRAKVMADWLAEVTR